MAHETSYWVRWQARRLAKVFAARRWKTGNLAAKSAAFAMSSVVARPAEMDDESKTGSTPPDAPTCRASVASLRHRDGLCDILCRFAGAGLVDAVHMLAEYVSTHWRNKLTVKPHH